MENDIYKATQLYRNYQLEESREILEQLISSDEDNIEALVLLGKIHSRTQNYGVAMNYFNKVLSVDKNNSEADIGLKMIKNILQLTNNFYYENTYTDDHLYDFE